MFFFCQTKKKKRNFYQKQNSQRLSLSFLWLLKKNPTDNRSRVEIKPLTDSPLAVNCTDRIRFNTTLDFLSPPRKVRNDCLAFLCHPFVSLEIKSKLDRYCVVKRHIKGSVLVATAVLENYVERKQAVCGSVLPLELSVISQLDVVIN